ncbi:MAG TPA: AAA family ATPase [Candidatus Babeliales bacterium]|nr:AAA family ATPase [Candidatus Babeliales bacterium]
MREGSNAPEPARDARLHVALLGHVALEFGGKPFEFKAPRKTQPILAYLLLHRQSTVSRDFLAFTMWPDADEDVARANLRRNLSLLKEALPPPDPVESWIVATNELVRWNAEAPLWLDVAEFDRLSSDSNTLADAVALYRGDLLIDLYDDWVHSERERLRSLYLSALKTLVYRARSNRDFSRAIAFAQQLLAADPFREDAARELAAAHYQAGDRAGALRSIDEFVKRVRAELGTDTMPETLALREAILREHPPGDALHDGAKEAHATPKVSAPAELPFVGRQELMKRAAVAWDQAARGRGTVLFVSGEAGIGKSRLVAELALTVEREGGRVVIGTTAAPESYAYQGFVEALRAAIPHLLASSLQPVWRAVLAGVVPDLADRIAVAPAPALPPDEEKTRLFEAVVQALRAIAQTRPLLLILEDLHWSGAATAELLRFVGNRLTSTRIALVVTYRSEEVLRSHPLRAARRELEAHDRAAAIEMSPLDENAVEEICAQIAAFTEPAERTRLYERSLGNPLFLAELIRSRQEQPPQPGSDDRDATAPPTIAKSIAARLSRLGDSTRRALDIAAVAGNSFEFELLREVTGWNDGALLDAFDELVERHVLREATRRERGSYAFTHHLMRETAYGELDAKDRRRYHGIVARTIEGLYAAEIDRRASDLARHFALAGEPVAAAQRWLRAARGSLTTYANADAAEQASQGIELVANAAGAEELYWSLLDVRFDAEDRLGHRERQGQDVMKLVELARTLERPGFLREGLRREIGFAHSAGDHQRAAAAIQALQEEVEPPLASWQAFLVKSRAQLAFDRYEHAQAERLSCEAAELYRAAEDSRGEFDALQIAIDARIRCNRYDENRADLDRASALVTDLNDPASTARFLQSAMMEQIMRQDFSAVYRLAGDLLELMRAIGNRLGEARAHDRLATAANRLGRIGEAIEGYARALEIYESIGDRHGVRVVMNNWGSLDVAFGHIERGRKRLGDLRAAAAADDDWLFLYYAESNLGVAAHLGGDFAAAKAFELRALDLARRLGSEARAALVLGDLGEAEAELGNLDAALSALEEAVAIHRRVDQRLALVTDSSRLALLCARRGEFDRACALAQELWERYRASPELFEDPAELLWHLARTLHACGDPAAANELVELAWELQNSRLETIDVPEYRESLRGVRWYCDLLAARENAVWPALTRSEA